MHLSYQNEALTTSTSTSKKFFFMDRFLVAMLGTQDIFVHPMYKRTVSLYVRNLVNSDQ